MELNVRYGDWASEWWLVWSGAKGVVVLYLRICPVMCVPVEDGVGLVGVVGETFSSLPFQTLALHDFYQLPIQLELVGDSHVLGFTLHLANRSITFNQPTSPWQIRDACSAGSRRLTLSGLLSRGTTIHRYSFPSNIVHSSLETLLQAYISKGHNETLCRQTLKKLFNTCNPVAWITTMTTLYYFANIANMQRANRLSWTSMTSATIERLAA